MEAMKIRNLYNLEETIAAPLLEQYEYPWEVLPYIKEFIKALGNALPEDRFEKRGEDIWVAKSATVAPTACLNGSNKKPVIITNRGTQALSIDP